MKATFKNNHFLACIGLSYEKFVQEASTVFTTLDTSDVELIVRGDYKAMLHEALERRSSIQTYEKAVLPCFKLIHI